MSSTRKIHVLVFLVAIAVAIAPFVIKIVPISGSADYFNAYWSLSATILLGYFAWVTYEHSKVLEKPILTAETIKEGQSSYYVIKNCGQVPALNVKLFIRPSEQSINPEYAEMILCGSIKTDEYKVISWYKGVFKIALVYQDFSGKFYSTIVQNDYCENKKGDILKVDHRGFLKGKKQLYFGDADKTKNRTLFRYDDRMDEESQEIQNLILQKLKS